MRFKKKILCIQAYVFIHSGNIYDTPVRYQVVSISLGIKG